MKLRKDSGHFTKPSETGLVSSQKLKETNRAISAANIEWCFQKARHDPPPHLRERATLIKYLRNGDRPT